VPKCDHNIPETLKGEGPCDIVYEVKKRNGTPQWWCKTHAREAEAPDGQALNTCPAAWFEAVPDERQLDLHVEDGEFSIWGALAPAIQIGNCHLDEGGVHVHQRGQVGHDKLVDGSFEIVRIHTADGRELVAESMSARAFSVSVLEGQPIKAMHCPRCGFWHIDEEMFATNPHRKHQCNGCGRNFWDSTGPSIVNPLASAYEQLGLTPPPPPVQVNRPLDLRSEDFGGIAIWPSNRSIVSNRSTAEDCGLHVHAWDHDGNEVVNETFSPVTLDGDPLDEAAVRMLGVQRTLAHGRPIVALPCDGCGKSLTSPTEGWINPRTVHTCPGCGGKTRTRRRSFLNPLAEK
jgi:hypothetical protein